MTVRAQLWKYKPRKDGSCNIKIYIQSGKTKRWKKTPFYCKPSEWDSRAGKMKTSVPLANKINAALAKLVNEEKGKLIGSNSSLIELINRYIEDCKAGREDLRPGTWKKFITLRNHLNRYAVSKGLNDISFEDIDLTFYDAFTQHLRENGCGRAGVGGVIKVLKKFMHLGLDRGLHENRAFQTKSFVAEKVRPANKIYLTPDEIESLARLNLKGRPGLARERDRFLVSYYLVLRYSDSVLINRGSIINHDGTAYYQNTAVKTGTTSIVPIKPVALEIIKRNDYDLSGDTNQEANRKLKVLSAMAGINQDMSKPGEGHLPKSALVTTHTARRSAATNLHLAGVPLSEIMQLGGWKYEATLKQYLLAGGIRLAELSAKRDFFQ
ncbi:tyrosine-type recombinase/integrase [Lewinella sp. W8]|nr:tyrosine-type recombinase/integrase [Lewinella sp. W8]